MTSLLSPQASAQGPNANNSQNMPLLTPNISLSQVLQEKDSKKDEKDAPIDPNAKVNIVADNSLLPTATPMGTGGSSEASDFGGDQTSVYVVRKNDSLSRIAEMFGVSTNTILWSNNMKKGDKLVEGDVLLILPVSGLTHSVKKGDTLKNIAAYYKTDINDILQVNDIAIDTQLNVGDKLIIPDAERAEESDKPIKDPKATEAKDKKYYEVHPTKTLSGYYINPVPSARKSQGLHDGNAVDLAAPIGTAIRAAASGTVIFSKDGYNGGFGNLIIVSHPNGTQTLYAHQSKRSASMGEHVSQGEVIGYVGSTGRSTGPHLHFAVKGAKNPGADGSWAK